MIRGERREIKQAKAFRKAYFANRNNRKALEVVIQARRNK